MNILLEIKFIYSEKSFILFEWNKVKKNQL